MHGRACRSSAVFTQRFLRQGVGLDPRMCARLAESCQPTQSVMLSICICPIWMTSVGKRGERRHVLVQATLGVACA